MSFEMSAMQTNSDEEGFDSGAQMREDLEKINTELGNDTSSEEQSNNSETRQNIVEQQERNEALLERFDRNSKKIKNLSPSEMEKNPEGLPNLGEKIKGIFSRFIEEEHDPERTRMKVIVGSLGMGVLAATANILGTPELNDTIAALPEQLQTFLQSPQSAFNALNLIPLESFNPEWNNINTPEFVEQIRASENSFMEFGTTEKGVRIGSALTNVVSGTGVGIVLGTLGKKITETLNTLGAKMHKQKEGAA
ncbi:MAG: hypothetical protein H8D63_02960 [Parcubacteria group bacterium]|nr:hypothetical protein [Parcubacteria group bacterium]